MHLILSCATIFAGQKGGMLRSGLAVCGRCFRAVSKIFLDNRTTPPAHTRAKFQRSRKSTAFYPGVQGRVRHPQYFADRRTAQHGIDGEGTVGRNLSIPLAVFGKVVDTFSGHPFSRLRARCHLRRRAVCNAAPFATFDDMLRRSETCVRDIRFLIGISGFRADDTQSGHFPRSNCLKRRLARGFR